MDTLIQLLLNHINNNTFVYLFIIYVIVIYCFFRKWHDFILQYLKVNRWKFGVAVIVLTHVFLMYIYTRIENQISLMGILSTVILSNVVIFSALVFTPSKERQIIEKSAELKLIEQYRALDRINPSKLTPKDYILHQRALYNTLYRLGNIDQALNIARNVEIDNSPRLFLMEAIASEAAGDMVNALSHILKAVDLINSESDTDFKIHTLLNASRLYKSHGNINASVAYLREAHRLVDNRTGVKLTYIVYKELISSLIDCNTDYQEISALIDEFQDMVDLSNPKEVKLGINLRLQVAVLLDDTDMQHILVETDSKELRKLLNGDKNLGARLAYNTMAISKAINLGIDIDEYLDDILNDIDKINLLDSFERYCVWKKIYSLPHIKHHGKESLDVKIETLHSLSAAYLSSNAEIDVKNYVEDLPVQVVHPWVRAQAELLYISDEIKHNLSFPERYERIMTEAEVYSNHGLTLMAAETLGIFLITNCFLPDTIDEVGDTYFRDEIQEVLNRMEKMTAKMKSHERSAQYYLEMSYGYIQIHDYDNAVVQYEKYRKCKVNVNKYTDWAKHHIEFVEVACKCCKMMMCISQLRTSRKYNKKLSKEAVSWIEDYDKRSSREIAIMAGLVINPKKVTLKDFSWDSDEGEKLHHYWLCCFDKKQTNLLELDLCFGRVMEKDEIQRFLVFSDRHPVEVDYSEWRIKNTSGETAMQKEIVTDFTECSHLVEIASLIRGMLKS